MRIWWCQEHRCSGAERICVMAEWIDEVDEAPLTRQPCRMAPASLRLIPDDAEAVDRIIAVLNAPAAEWTSPTDGGIAREIAVAVLAALDGETP